MEQKVIHFMQYFNEEIDLCEQRNRQLLAEGRTDEATFEKVKANIFGIFRTVLTVAQDSCKGNEAEIGRFFALRIEQIPASWQISCAKAEAHNDEVKQRFEQIKLDTAARIRARFCALWEAAQ